MKPRKRGKRGIDLKRPPRRSLGSTQLSTLCILERNKVKKTVKLMMYGNVLIL